MSSVKRLTEDIPQRKRRRPDEERRRESLWERRSRSGLVQVLERRPAGEAAGVAELLLDPQQLVVLGDAVGARGGAGLDLAAIRADGQLGDERVLGLAAS